MSFSMSNPHLIHHFHQYLNNIQLIVTFKWIISNIFTGMFLRLQTIKLCDAILAIPNSKTIFLIVDQVHLLDLPNLHVSNHMPHS